MDEENPFEELAVTYDSTIDWDSRLRREMPFLQDSITSPTKRVLDLACGTGKHAIALAKYGASVIGIDISRKMIEAAKRNATDSSVNVQWIISDMIEFQKIVSGQFDLVLCLGNSLALLDGMSSVQRIFESVHQVLGSSGFFVFQVLNDKFLSKKQIFTIPQRVGQLSTGKKVVFTRFFNTTSDSSFIELVLTSFIEVNRGWEVTTTYQSVLRMNSDEIREMLLKSGFSSVEVFADYEKSSFNDLSHQSMVFRAKA